MATPGGTNPTPKPATAEWVQATAVFDFPGLFEVRCKQTTFVYRKGTDPMAAGGEIAHRAGDNVLKRLPGLTASGKVQVRHGPESVSVFDWK